MTKLNTDGYVHLSRGYGPTHLSSYYKIAKPVNFAFMRNVFISTHNETYDPDVFVDWLIYEGYITPVGGDHTEVYVGNYGDGPSAGPVEQVIYAPKDEEQPKPVEPVKEEQPEPAEPIKENTNVTDPVIFRKAIIEEVEESLRDAVYSFAGKVTVAEIIGIMEVLKYELLKED